MADEETIERDLSHLSPFAVLKQQTPVVPPAPVTPTSVAPSAPVQPIVSPVPMVPAQQPPLPAPPDPSAPTPVVALPSREELLRQAAEAPDTTLILPIDTVVAPPPLPIPPPQAAAIPVSTLPKPPVLPEPVKPVSKPASHIDPDIEVMHTHRHKRISGKLIRNIAIIAGVVIVLGAIAAVFLMTLNGTRFPYIYSKLSKLSPTGLGESAKALSVVNLQPNYQITAKSEINLQLASGGATSLSSGSNPVSKIVTSIQSAKETVSTQSLLADVLVNSTGNVQVPLLYKTGDTQWTITTSSSSQIVLVSDLSQTLLSVAIQPPNLSMLLKAVTAETSYAQVTSGGTREAEYGYALDPKLLAKAVMTDATFSSPTAVITYPWKSNLPATAVITAKVSYQNVSYTYTATLSYTNWGSASVSKTLSALGAGQTTLGINTLIADLGFASGTLPEASGIVTLPPAPVAQSPTGLSTTSILPVITTVPPLPATTATAAAIARDTQRKADMTLLQSALESYKTAHGEYPISNGLEQVQNSKTLLSALVPTYLTALPIDPLSSTYWYEYISAPDGSSYTLRCVAENPSDPAAKLGTSYHYFVYYNL